jgi:transcriptional regulator with XRE-family HTH domain
MSQLDLGLEANVSARHLSFVETGRSQPSREMVLTLAEHLQVPLREQNALLPRCTRMASLPASSTSASGAITC